MTENLIIATAVLFSLIVVLVLSFRALRKNRLHSGERRPEIGFIVETFHDLIDKLKQKEKELEVLKKEAEDRAERITNYNEYILQSVPSGVISLDTGMKITRVNAAAEKILGIKEAEYTGKNYEEVFGGAVSSLADNSRSDITRGEITYISGSGKQSRLGISLTPLKDSGGNTIGRLLVFTDITEFKALEAQAALRDRLSSLGEMAAGMAHELRNPMGVIAGYTKIISKKEDPSLEPIADSIYQEVSSMDRIITDFLSFARPAELNVSSFDLADTIRLCISNTLKERDDIKVNMDIPHISGFEGDEILLRQAFINLFNNASEAMSNGGALDIRAVITGEDHYSGALSAGRIDISITDSGHGIPANMLENIFLPFYTTKDRGTGLGLAIVHKSISLHNGTVRAESSGQGTTFRISLPLKAQKKQAG